MHGTFQTNGGVPIGPSPRALGPSGGATMAPAGSTNNRRAPLSADDPRAKAYIDG